MQNAHLKGNIQQNTALRLVVGVGGGISASLIARGLFARDGAAQAAAFTWRRRLVVVLRLLQGPEKLLDLIREVRLLDEVFGALVAGSPLQTHTQL